MIEEITKFLYEYGEESKNSAVGDLHDLLAIVKKLEQNKNVYLGKKDQNTIDTISEKYSINENWDTISTAQKQVVANRVKKLGTLFNQDIGVEVAKYQRGLYK